MVPKGASMETQNQPVSETSFGPGSQVIYGLIGRCSIVAIETRQIGGESISFYKLEVSKPALSRSTKPEPAIWLPVNSARERGLRSPINSADSANVMAILSSREYYFSLDESWSAVQPKLETCIRSEGAIGLAKVASYLHVLKKREVNVLPEVNRYIENVHKHLFRELSEVTGETIRVLEEKAAKGFRQKLLPDN
jgi:RNA polymerase-interacting CarD/CdnL/TRCF family regulator